MSNIIRHNRVLAWSIAGVLMAAGLWQWSTIGRCQPAPARAPELAKLQQEQIATLREAAGAADKLFAQGTTSSADAGRLHRMLLEAELAAATTARQRIDILRDALTAAKTQEEIASSQFKAGMATHIVPLEAKAYRLGIEIKLAEEEAK